MDYNKLISEYPELFSNRNVAFRIITNPDEINDWQKHRRVQLMQSGQPSEWANIGIVFDDPYFVILRDLVEFPASHNDRSSYRNGYVRLYARAYLEGRTAIVVILPEMNGKLLLIHQFRHATRAWHWEIPRGFGEPGVDSRTQAINELREEIRGEISDIIDLGVFYHNAAFDGNPADLFLAHLVSVGEPQIEEGVEDLKLFSLAQVEQMIADGDITDGFTIAAYTKAKLKGLI